MSNKQEKIWSDSLVWIFLGASGLIGILLVIRTVIAWLLLIISFQLLAQYFDLWSWLLVLVCGLAAVGQLPLCFNGNHKELPKIKYAVLALMASVPGLIFAGVIIYGLILSNLAEKLPSRYYYWMMWSIAIPITLNDTILLFYSLIFSISKSRKIISQEFEKWDEKPEKNNAD